MPTSGISGSEDVRRRAASNGPRRGMSSERKTAYAFGVGFTVLGVILFLWTLVGFFSAFGDPSFFETGRQPRLALAAIGVGLILAGKFMRRIGARGLAGSGLVLDPEQARSDLEPHARTLGGLVGDALDEAKVDLRQPTVIRIRCRACQRLNEDDSKFCQECGQAL